MQPSSSTSTSGKNPAPLFWPALILITLFGVLVRINVAWKHTFPEGDEGPWLRLASQAGTSDFMATRVVEHDYFKTPPSLPRPEDNRAPVYPFIIALFKWVHPDLFRAGQAANITVYILMSAVMGMMLRTMLGPFISAGFLMFLACSPHFIRYSAHIYPELLVALLFFIFIAKSGQSFASRKAAVLFGIGLGLFFMLKSTAVFIFPVILFHFMQEWRIRKKRFNLLLLFAVFFFTALPWLIRNMIHFGSPTYQLVTLTLYMDNMNDIFLTGLDIPNLSGYLRREGLLFVFFLRPLLGAVEIAKTLPFDDNNLCAVALPLSLAGIWSLRKRADLWRPHGIFALFYLPLMCYIAYNSFIPRYLMILYIWLYTLACAGAVKIASLFKGRWLPPAAASIAVALPLLLTTAYPLEFFLSGRGSEKEKGEAARKAVVHTASILPAEEAVLSSFASGFSYLRHINTVNMLRFRNARDLNRIIRQYKVTGALLAPEDTIALDSLFGATECAYRLMPEKSFPPFTLYRVAASGNAAPETGPASEDGFETEAPPSRPPL